ncbi:hypothetical protein NF672_14820 [Pseudomonas moraviensis]|uniref:hypothetical protein n=1 Tax=Pseudomonas moraviensis TaxID=321662 RepID=UPI0020938E70|nr:hypothetical protein [Pseudomonas moraviensis]UST56731.1 hypothetical protein NF672_14820 [Pseudomonas moraviensis]
MSVNIFKIDQYQAEVFKKAIRSRFDILKVWMDAVKLIINYAPPAEEFVAAEIHVHNSRMSRLFYLSDSKTFSIAFPFRIEAVDDSLTVRTSSGIEVDSELSSEITLVASLLKNEGLVNEWALAEHFEDQGGASAEFWPVLASLLDAEDGYLRFDHDPVRTDGHKHPLDHADLFYTNGASFKVGLQKKPTIDEIIDILNRETDCHYLNRVVVRK